MGISAVWKLPNEQTNGPEQGGGGGDAASFPRCIVEVHKIAHHAARVFAFCIDDNCENHGTCASQSRGHVRGQLRRLASKGRCAATNYDFGVCRKSQHVEKGTRILFCKRLCATLLLLGFRAKKSRSVETKHLETYLLRGRVFLMM